MREIKYRYTYKDIKDGIILFDYKTIDEIEESTPEYYKHRNMYFCRIARDEYTGLKDKNGKEIYEGDIIKLNPDKYKQGYHEGDPEKIYSKWDYPESMCEIGEITRVEHDDSNGGFIPFTDYDSDCGIYNHAKHFEVIGNIYENSELLND